MEPAAFPAASTIKRPLLGGFGKCSGRQEEGCAAAIAVRKSPSNIALAVIRPPLFGSEHALFAARSGLPRLKLRRYNASKLEFLREGIGRSTGFIKITNGVRFRSGR